MLGLLALDLTPATVMASDSSPRLPWWTSVGMLTGATQPGAALANDQWSTMPRAAWGLEGLAGRGRFAGGLRLWRTRTTQTLELPDGTHRPAIDGTRLEVLGQGRLATLWGSDMVAELSAGNLHLGWSPEHLTIDTGAGGPVDVRFAALDTWIAGAGLGLRRSLAADWTLGIAVNHGFFALDTAHRNGTVIEQERTSFGEWNARLALARRFHSR